MKRQFINKLVMIEAVQTYLSQNGSSYTDIPEITQKLSELNAVRSEIYDAENLQTQITSAAASAKAEARAKAESAVYELAGVLNAFGKNEEDVELAAKTYVTSSYIKRMRDINLVVFLTTVKELASAHIAGLPSYGVTQEALNAYAETFTGFVNALGKKESLFAERSSAIGKISKLFKDADEAMIAIDALVRRYKVNDTTFYRGYKSARSIKNLGERKTKLPDVTENQLQK
jgi:hypothetical protein